MGDITITPNGALDLQSEVGVAAKLSNDWGPSLTVRQAEGPVDEPLEALMDHMEGMDNSNDH